MAKFRARVPARQQRRPFIVTVKHKDFMGVINQWPGLSEKQIEAILDEVTLKAFDHVKARTPVLTGEAQSQWFFQLPHRWRRFIGNNWPGIRRLEHGWSKQPQKQFMVRSAEKKFPFWVKEAARRLWTGDALRKAA